MLLGFASQPTAYIAEFLLTRTTAEITIVSGALLDEGFPCQDLPSAREQHYEPRGGIWSSTQIRRTPGTPCHIHKRSEIYLGFLSAQKDRWVVQNFLTLWNNHYHLHDFFRTQEYSCNAFLPGQGGSRCGVFSRVIFVHFSQKSFKYAKVIKFCASWTCFWKLVLSWALCTQV